MGSPHAQSYRTATRQRTIRAMAMVVAATIALSGCLTQLQGSGPPGGWATEFLRDAPYSRLIVEIDHDAGAAPESATQQKLDRILRDRLNKPDGIEITVNGGVAGKGAGAKYSFSEIRELESQHRDHRKGGDTAVIYILFLNGGSAQDSGDSRVLGAVYSGSSMVMFKDNIRAVEQRCKNQTLGLPIGCPPLRVFEDAVTTHELGHVLGLVNIGIPMLHDREDPQSEGHSRYETSVMYYAVRSGDIVNFILQGNQVPTEFDQHDIADIRNAGGK